jgi:hypothetical protein
MGIGAVCLTVAALVRLGELRFVFVDAVIDGGTVRDGRPVVVYASVLATAPGRNRLVAEQSGSCCAKAKGVERSGPGLLSIPITIDPTLKPPGAYLDHIPITLEQGDTTTTRPLTLRYTIVRAGR